MIMLLKSLCLGRMKVCFYEETLFFMDPSFRGVKETNPVVLNYLTFHYDVINSNKKHIKII